MRRICLLLALPALVSSAGCGGHYTVVVPDQVVPAGGSVTVVARLLRNDFFVLDLPAKKAPVRFRLAGGIERAAFTDDLGYAAVQLSAPAEPGLYSVSIDLQDTECDEASGAASTWVWDPKKPVIAVDLDCLPRRRPEHPTRRSAVVAAMARYTVDLLPRPVPKSAAAARFALARMAKKANILYLTRRSMVHHEQVRQGLKTHGYPDGPVLLWRRQRWHIVPGWYRIPRIVVESRLVSQLGRLRQDFTNLALGVCDSALAAKAFVEAGMTVLMVGGAAVDGEKIQRFADWKALAAEGL